MWIQLTCQAMLNAATNPHRYEPMQAGALNLADQERIRQEAERAVQLAAEQVAHQTFLAYPATSVEVGVATRTEVFIAWF